MAKKKATTKKIDAKGVNVATPAAEPMSVVKETTVAVVQSEVVISHEQISDKAREIWALRGYPAGQDLEIWLEAERALRG